MLITRKLSILLFRKVSASLPHNRCYHRKAPQPTSPEFAHLLSNYASPRPINLSTLLSFGRPLTPDSLLASVSYALSEIPRRLATRIRSHEALPFIVGTNPYVAKTLKAYRESFQWLATYPPVRNLDENGEFVTQLECLVQSHVNDIPTLAKGFQECSPYMSSNQISTFLDGAIRNRISVRLIAEQHIALTRALGNSEIQSTHNGVVNMACSPMETIRICEAFVSQLCEVTLGVSPSIIIDGHLDATFAYVPVHLEYILIEILKNSFRATVEHHYLLRGASSSQTIPPVLITISPPSKIPGNSARNFLTLRVRDEGGGVSPCDLCQIFSYAFTTAGPGGKINEDDNGRPRTAQRVRGSTTTGAGHSNEGNLFGKLAGNRLQTAIGTIAGLGYGLPLSKLYAKYFGGSLDLLSLDGWGSDVFLKLRCLDEAGDAAI